jgi:sugar lactone lactonase YvrE
MKASNVNRVKGATAALALTVGAVVALSAVSAPAEARPALSPCQVNGTDIFVSDPSAFPGSPNGGLIQVDSLTGTRSTLSENSNPVGGPDFETPLAMAFEADGNLVVAEGWWTGVAGANPGVVRVNRTTGVRTSVSNNTWPVGGPNFTSPNGIAVEADGSILVTDLGGSVIRVNPITGARTTLSDNSSPAGVPTFRGPWDIAVAANGDIFVVDTDLSGVGSKVIRVNPLTGARSLVSRNASPAGAPDFAWPWGLTLDPNGDLLVSDRMAFGGTGGIIRVNPITGVRTTVSSNATGAGPSFQAPGDLVFDCGAILVNDFFAQAVYRVDPVTGDRTTVSDNASPGAPNFAWNWGIAAKGRPMQPTVEPYPTVTGTVGGLPGQDSRRS